MQNFPDKLEYEDLTHETGKLRLLILAPFRYFVGGEGSSIVLTIPAGFVTDLASVSRLLWWVLPPFGRYTRAAVVHDFLYSGQGLSRAIADAIFLEAMTDLGVGRWKRWVMYAGVRLGGWQAFKKATRTVRG